jgi:hypothetical protein
MSNVRPRTKPDHGSTSAVRCAARALAPNTGCRRRFACGASSRARSRGRLGLSVLRRPAHGRISSNARNGMHASWRRVAQGTEPNVKSLLLSRVAAAVILRSSAGPQSAGQFSSSVAVARSALPELVCFAIQIQGRLASPRAWPNPSFKRTCLRHAA